MRQLRMLLRTFHRLSWPDRLMLVEATLCLGVAALAIACLPFRLVSRLASPALRGPEVFGPERMARLRRCRWAVGASARRVPWRALCFEQGLAAQWMLRRRGVPSTLYYGVAKDGPAGLDGHVWVRDGQWPVIGGANVSRYVVLAAFPGSPQR